ncbi:hypothetical protein [Nocardioides sp. GXQ0305]|uniref:hypothetical protein n=1 Tax=Nocardioides sp. GXQ0305 TaxID=3423912 RepID=UPI003D7DCD65
MRPTEDSFHALARSAPWRWMSLHFRHRSEATTRYGGEVEAWVERPGRTRVVSADAREFVETGLPYSRWPERDRRWPHLAAPTYRPDGLVAERPGDGDVDYDDPMFENFSWVAMLDPVELSHDVRVEAPREAEVAGRPVLRARVVAGPGYEPRCGGNCCELLFGEAGLQADFDDPSRVPADLRGRVYPAGYDVALDVATGVVVRCLPIGGDGRAPWLENDIVDAR